VQAFLRQVYGDQVAVAYYDAISADVQEQYHQVIEMASERFLPYPIVLINDEAVMAGHVDAYGIASLVAQELP
jgi:disulfide oxidoreductase YuzD